MKHAFFYVLAPSVADVQAAIEHIFPLVYEFRKEKTAEEMELHLAKRRRIHADPLCDPFYNKENQSEDDEEEWD